ncbi:MULTISPECIES: hypothetical protein [unclassified Mesorhizobium]|uniref:hypothetical protein n=1 Tax=unclassified Mesorhizobium TaxID=325217 RepID=UPI0011280F48|nr:MULTISPECIES: hypothetical protein [unclassified Mesorhizobium]MCA0027372.1 hypothetical protein [Mesorhizobium sp. B263B1A]TPJ98645.1 hypothetical protein FJ489_06875 [Mesorhizobium sp. B2-5-12]TPK28808.1 hypothetical protein FJ562_00265 [Mesorhizobium sp. B2-5-6]
MNAGAWPEGMSAERRDLIETLECLGFDQDVAGAGDWRTVFSDVDLRSAIDRLCPEEKETAHA